MQVKLTLPAVIPINGANGDKKVKIASHEFTIDVQELEPDYAPVAVSFSSNLANEVLETDIRVYKSNYYWSIDMFSGDSIDSVIQGYLFDDKINNKLDLYVNKVDEYIASIGLSRPLYLKNLESIDFSYPAVRLKPLSERMLKSPLVSEYIARQAELVSEHCADLISVDGRVYIKGGAPIISIDIWHGGVDLVDAQEERNNNSLYCNLSDQEFVTKLLKTMDYHDLNPDTILREIGRYKFDSELLEKNNSLRISEMMKFHRVARVYISNMKHYDKTDDAMFDAYWKSILPFWDRRFTADEEVLEIEASEYADVAKKIEAHLFQTAEIYGKFEETDKWLYAMRRECELALFHLELLRAAAVVLANEPVSIRSIL